MAEEARKNVHLASGGSAAPPKRPPEIPGQALDVEHRLLLLAKEVLLPLAFRASAPCSIKRGRVCECQLDLLESLKNQRAETGGQAWWSFRQSSRFVVMDFSTAFYQGAKL